MKEVNIATENKNQGKREPRLEDSFRINEEIRAARVRLVGANVEEGVYPISKALEIAREQELDLVEIFANAEYPVCKVIDFNKFIYEKKKKNKEIKQKSAKQVVKEIRFGPNTDEHDFNFKVNHAKKFLSEGSKIKAYVHFKGRTIAYTERGEAILLRFIQELEGIGKVEHLPKLEGKRMIITINPVKVK